MTVRSYGKPPYVAAALHGGPGAAGTAGYLASELAKKANIGVLEPIQSAKSIKGQVNELAEQLGEFVPPVLVGHSWGAWLALFYAAEHPVSKLVLIGCPPFLPEGAVKVAERRFKALSASEFEELKNCAVSAEKGDEKAFSRLADLADRADNVCLPASDPSADFLLPFQRETFEKVWAEADSFRKENGFESLLKKIVAPVFVLQGDKDPHAAEDAVLPLKSAGLTVREIIFENCGHSPFRERFVKDRFFQILAEIIRE